MLTHQKINTLEMNSMSGADKAEIAVNIGDSLNLGAIFSMFFSEKTIHFLEQFGKFGMFPAAAIGSIAEAGIAWYKVREEKLKAKQTGMRMPLAPAVDAVIKTAKALAITAAVVLSFVGFAAISPVIFALTLTTMTAIHAGAALSNLAAGRYREAFNSAKAAFLSAAATAAVVGVMLIGGPIVTLATAAVGVATAAAGIVFAFLRVRSALKKLNPANDGKGHYVQVPGTTAELGREIGINNKWNNSQEIIQQASSSQSSRSPSTSPLQANSLHRTRRTNNTSGDDLSPPEVKKLSQPF